LHRAFPSAIHLPYRGMKAISDHDNCNSNGGSSSSGSSCGSNGSRNNSYHCTDSADYSNTWLCVECQNVKLEGAEDLTTQKAYRSLEISELCLLSLYNTTRGRKKNKGRAMIKPPKKSADDRTESVAPIRLTEDSSDASRSFALLDGIWLESWLDFMSDTAVDKPGPLCNTPLCCKHGQVLVPPCMVHILGDVSPADLKSALGYEETSCKGFPDMEIITMAQWRALLRIYSPSSSSMSKRRKLNHSSSVVTIDMSDDTCADSGAVGVRGAGELDMSISGTVGASNSTSSAGPSEDNIEYHNGTSSIALDSAPHVFQVLISPPVPVPIPVPMAVTDGEGVHIPGPKEGFWTWSPSLCTVCRDDVVERMNDIHLNFERYSFEIVIVPLEVEDIVLEGDEDRERDRERERESKVDAEFTRPSSSSTASTAIANGGPSRRNPSRRRGCKSVRAFLSSTDSISLVKQKLAEKVDDSVCCGLGGHTLVYSGVHLTDHTKTLRDYNVRRDEVLQLLLSKSDISVDTLFGSTGNGKLDSYERGFGHNSFLTGSFPADTVSTAQEPSRIKDSQKIIDQIMLVTGCTADQAMNTLTRFHGNVNNACEALLPS
jgi:hypothetical protein